MTALLETRLLKAGYLGREVVQAVNLRVEPGEVVCLLGPNGAGKTTTLRMITGFLPPTDGLLTVGGRDLFSDPVAARSEVGYLPENVALYPEMRVSEYLHYRAMLEGLSRSAAPNLPKRPRPMGAPRSASGKCTSRPSPPAPW